MSRTKTHPKAAPATSPPARTMPLEHLKQCPACPRVVPLLVEGSGLCVRCDSHHYPELVIA